MFVGYAILDYCYSPVSRIDRRSVHVPSWLAGSIEPYHAQQLAGLQLLSCIDSGIGKTTLLNDLVRELRTQPGVFVGFHETDNGEPDALLKALDSLLQSIRTSEHSVEQLRLAYVKAIDGFSLTSVRKFLLKTVKLSGKFVGYEFLADAIGAAAEAAHDLELKPQGIPELGIDEFRSILKILTKALPQNKFVLVVDNLSAAVGSLGREVPGLSTLNTISSYLSIDFHRSDNIHLLVWWQRQMNAEVMNSLLRHSPETDMGGLSQRSLREKLRQKQLRVTLKRSPSSWTELREGFGRSRGRCP